MIRGLNNKRTRLNDKGIILILRELYDTRTNYMMRGLLVRRVNDGKPT